MDRLLVIAFIVLLFCGCSAPELLPLTSSPHYNPTLVYANHTLTADNAWNRVVRYFANHNLPIKIIDKNSGFIQSDILSFTDAYKIDSDTGSHIDTPYVIVQHETAYGKVIEPSYITGFLKIFLIPDSTGTEVRVSIEDLKNYHLTNVYHKHSATVTHNEIGRGIVSTGVLETQIAAFINTGIDTANLYVQKGELLNPKSNYAIYLKKKNNIMVGSLLGGELGGAVLIVTSAILFAPKKK